MAMEQKLHKKSLCQEAMIQSKLEKEKKIQQECLFNLDKIEKERKMNAIWHLLERKRPLLIKSKKKRRLRMPKKTPSFKNSLKKTSGDAERKRNLLNCVKNSIRRNLTRENVKNRCARKKKDKILKINFKWPNHKPLNSRDNRKRKNSHWRR